MAMGARLGDVNLELDGGDAAALHVVEAERGAGPERFKRGDKAGLVRAGIGQSANQHVSADSGKRVEIADLVRHEFSLSYVSFGLRFLCRRVLLQPSFTFFQLVECFRHLAR